MNNRQSCSPRILALYFPFIFIFAVLAGGAKTANASPVQYSHCRCPVTGSSVQAGNCGQVGSWLTGRALHASSVQDCEGTKCGDGILVGCLSAPSSSSTLSPESADPFSTREEASLTSEEMYASQALCASPDISIGLSCKVYTDVACAGCGENGEFCSDTFVRKKKFCEESVCMKWKPTAPSEDERKQQIDRCTFEKDPNQSLRCWNDFLEKHAVVVKKNGKEKYCK